MPIPIACPSCQTKMNLMDNLAGKRVRCKSCQYVFPVPPSDEPLDAIRAAPKADDLMEVTAAPKREPLLDVVRPDDDDAPPPRKSKTWLFLLIGGAAAALLLLCLLPVGLVAALLFMPAKTNTVTTPISQTNTNPPTVIPQNPAPNPNPNPPPDPGPGPRPRPRPNPNPIPPPPPEIDLDANAQPGPKVPADPLPTPLQAPANPDATVPLPSETNNTPVRYSLLPSPFVAVLPKGRNGPKWEIWNLQSMKKLGAVGEVTRSPLVSPDGTYVATNVYNDRRNLIRATGVEIFTVADGKSLRTIQGLDTERGIADFVGGDLVLSVQSKGRGGSVRLWNVKTGESVSSFEVTGSVDVWWWAVSPGGRYLALYDTFDAKHVINVYELKTGKLVRTFHPKLPPAQWYNCMGLAFSYDGKGFAALITVQGKTDRLQAWDFETGQRTTDHTFATPLEKTAKVPVGMRQTALQWLPDGSGWIAYQSLLIDRVRGHVFWTIPQEDPAGAYWMRRFLDAHSVATVAGKKPQRQLVILTLAKDQLDAARKK